MKKNALLKLLSVVVGVMVIVASVVCLTAVNAADDFGTEADGITVNSKTAMDSWTATEGLKNGDFSEGLKYWGPSNYYGSTAAEGKTSDVVKLVTDGTNKYAQFTGGLSFASSGVQIVPVKVSVNKIDAGDKLAVMYKGDAAPASAKMKVILWQFNIAAGKDEIVNCTAANIKVYKGIDATWALLNTINTLPVQENATESEFYTFAVEFRATQKTCVARFDDVKIVKVKDDGFYTLDGLKIDENGDPIEGSGSTGGGEGGAGEGGEVSNDPAWAGTEAEGVTMYQGDGINAVIMGDFVNGNFEKGLKYWAAKANTYYPSNVAEIKTEANGNKYLYLKGASEGYYGFKTAIITIPDSKLAVGDQVVIVFDYKSNEDANCLQIPLTQRFAGDRLSQTFAGDLIIGDEWCTGYIGVKPGMTVAQRKPGNNPGYAESGYYAFQMMVECKNAGDTISLDNIRIAKLVGNKIVDLDGNVISEDVTNPVDNTTGSGSAGGNGGSAGGSGTGNGNGSGTNTGSSATTGETLPVMPLAVAGIVIAASAVILRKKVR